MKLGRLICLLAMFLAFSASAEDRVRIVVGYQPYDTISYSAVVIRALELWKKHLPPGTEVEFQDAMMGTIIVNRMQNGTAQIGYLGDMPAAVATSQREIAPIRMVANLGYSQGQRCGIVMVRHDAPMFASPVEGVRWLNGKHIGVTRGSCADRFLQTLIRQNILKPASVRHMTLEIIAAKLHAKEIDGAMLWESTASRIGSLVGEKIGRVAATGYSFGMHDAGSLVMREDFLQSHPQMAEGWLKAELEAQRFILDPKNQHKVAEFVQQQTVGVSKRTAWFSLYGAIPPERGGGPVRDEKRFVIDADVRAFFLRTYSHLHAAGAIASATPPPEALDDRLARKVAAEARVTLPLGKISAQPLSAAPK